jgi:acyl carrier protein
MLDKIKMLAESAIRQQDMLLSEPIDLSRGEDSPLYGINSAIDSLTLVSIIVDIEEKIRSQFGVEVRLADTSDQPPSATPFATLGTLVVYVMDRLSPALDAVDAPPREAVLQAQAI